MLGYHTARRLVALCAVVLLLNGCWLRLAYDNADRLLLWQVDRYFDLASTQRDQTRDRLRALLAWHRSYQLDPTIAFLRRVQDRAQDSIEADEVDATLREFDELRGAIARHVAGDAAALFAQVDDEQLRHLAAALEESNVEWRGRAQQSPSERHEARVERVLRITQEWVGSLSGVQRDALSQAALALPDHLDAWLTYRAERQRQFVALVRAARDAQSEVASILPDWIMAPSPFQARNDAALQYIYRVDELATPAQRDYFLAQLQAWIDDLNAARDA